MSDRRDPVERVFGSSRDLYDLATWENRTPLDAISVSLATLLALVSRILVVGIALGIIVFQLALSGFAVLRNPTLGILTLFSAVPALGLVAYIWYGDPTLRQSTRSLVVTFALGVVFAGFAAVLNTVAGPLFVGIPVVGMALFFFLVVGPVEEFVKWLAIRLYAYKLDEFEAVIDGAIYGAVAGLGFATIENAIYITRVYLEAVQLGVNLVPAAIGIASVRSLAGPGHVIYSAFAGYYLGLARFNPDDAGPIVVKGLLIATLVHGTYNTAVTYLPDLVPFTFLSFLVFVLVYDGLFLAILFRKLSRYRHAYHDALAVDE